MTKQQTLSLFLRSHPEGAQGAEAAFDEALRELLSRIPDLKTETKTIELVPGEGVYPLPGELLHLRSAFLNGKTPLAPSAGPFPLPAAGTPREYWISPALGAWTLSLHPAPIHPGTAVLTGAFYAPLGASDELPPLPNADALLALMKAKHARDFRPEDQPAHRDLFEAELLRIHEWLSQRLQGEAQQLLPIHMLDPRPIY